MINNCKNIPRKVVLVLVCRTKTNALLCVSPLSKQLWYELCASKQTVPHHSEVKGLNKYRQGLSVPYTFEALIRVYILTLLHYFHGKKLMTNLFEEKIKIFLMNVTKTFYYNITVVKNGKFGTPEGAWFMWMTYLIIAILMIRMGLHISKQGDWKMAFEFNRLLCKVFSLCMHWRKEEKIQCINYSSPTSDANNE